MDNKELRKLLEQARREHLNGNEYAFDPVFKYCYKHYKSRCIKDADFKVAFLDAMFKIWEKFILKQDPLPEKSANYISRTINNTWKNHQKKGGKNKPTNMDDEIIEYLNNKKQDDDDHNLKIEENEIYERRFWALAIAYLKLNECCQAILMKIHYEGKKLKDIVGICGYNYTTLKTKKNQCKNKWGKIAQDLLNE